MRLSTWTRRGTAAIALASLALTAACDEDGSTSPAPQTITQIASATPNLSTLTSALTAANLATTLNGAGPFTVFAPANSAFSALPSGVVERLLESGNLAILTKLLRYHVIAGRFPASSLSNGQLLTTVEGTTLPVTVAGGIVTVGGARVTAADIDASNGVVHLVDGVLLGSLDIVDQATIRGFSSLVSAVASAGLVTTLRGGSLTVFAPTNAAFAAIPGGAPTDPAALSQVLRLHVVGATALSTALTNGQTVASLLGPNLTIGITGSGASSSIRITGPTNFGDVVARDVVAKNGVIHVIDKVLLP